MTPQRWPGRLLLAIVGAFAELKRDMISERTRAGLAAAVAKGQQLGRPPALSADQVAAARQMYDAGGRTVAQLARLFGVSRPTIYRALDPSPDQCQLPVGGCALEKLAHGGDQRRHLLG